jgi:hypothetical protein
MASEEVQVLLAQWDLEKHAAVFAELGVDKVRDLQWFKDSDIEGLQLPTFAKRKAQAMLDWWRTENPAEPARKKVKQEPVEQELGKASGGGARGMKGRAAPANKAASAKQECAERTVEGKREPVVKRDSRRGWVSFARGSEGRAAPLAEVKTSEAKTSNVIESGGGEYVSLKVKGPVCPAPLPPPPTAPCAVLPT